VPDKVFSALKQCARFRREIDLSLKSHANQLTVHRYSGLCHVSRGKTGIRADFLNIFSQCFSGRETASIY